MDEKKITRRTLVERGAVLGLVVLAGRSLAACGGGAPDCPTPPGTAAPPASSIFEALAPVETNPARAALGRSLFFDTRLSGDGTISCATCHMPDHGGAEPDRTSTGIRDQLGPINAPTVFNS